MTKLFRHATLALLCAGCTTFPQLDATVPESVRDAPFPNLLPFEQLRAPPRSTPAAQTTLTARSAALNARAAQLRGAIIDGEARKRMEQGVSGNDLP